jgi:hypothetical protein
MVVTGDGGDHQDGIGFLLVKRAMRDVRDAKVLDHLAAFEFEVADLIELVRSVVRPMCAYRKSCCEHPEHHACLGKVRDDAAHADLDRHPVFLPLHLRYSTE